MPNRLARTIEVTVGGSLLSWAFYRQGPDRSWVRDDLEAVLGPYLGDQQVTDTGRR